MKKRLLILLAVPVLLSAGCGQQAKNDNSSVASAVSETSAVSQTSQPSETSAVSQTSQTSEKSAVSETVSDGSGDESSVLILESNTSKPEIIEFSIDNNRPFNTIEEYLETDTAKEMVKRLSEAEGSEVIMTAVFAEGGTKLVFERQLSTEFNLWLTDEFLENVSKSVESKKDTFIALVDSLETCVNSKVLQVVVRYVDPEGNILYERAFNNDRLDESSDTSGTSDTSDTSGTSDTSETSDTSGTSDTSETSEISGT